MKSCSGTTLLGNEWMIVSGQTRDEPRIYWLRVRMKPATPHELVEAKDIAGTECHSLASALSCLKRLIQEGSI